MDNTTNGVQSATDGNQPVDQGNNSAPPAENTVNNQPEGNTVADDSASKNVQPSIPESTTVSTTTQSNDSSAQGTSGVPQAKAESNEATQAGTDVTQQAQEVVSQGVDQVQQAGQAGIQKVGDMVGQVLQPKKDETNQPPVAKDEKIYAAISYIPFMALVSIIIKPDSAFVRLHAKQGLLLAIIFFFVGLLAAIVSLFGIVGQFLAFLLGLVPLAILIVDGYSMYLSFSGYWWKIPVLGAVADIIPVEWMAKTSKQNITGQVGVAKVDYDDRKDVLKQETNEAQSPKPTVDLNASVDQTVPAQTTPVEGAEKTTSSPGNVDTQQK